ncbi:hypothetical protein FRB95_013825, partial [Tulasnella sp. JGI-2019a]
MTASDPSYLNTDSSLMPADAETVAPDTSVNDDESRGNIRHTTQNGDEFYASGLYGGYYVDVQFTIDYISILHNMAQVCRRWLEIIKGTPGLWTFVADREPKNAPMTLARSQFHPIGISLRNRPFNKSVYAMVLNHSRRWIRADILFSPSNEEALRSLEDISVPILRRLRIEYITWVSDPTFILDLFRDHPPRLTSLALVNVTMRRWNSLIFGTHLYSLQLVEIRTFGPTREEFYDIFRACPKLAHLELVDVAFSGEMPQGSRVQLAGLETMILKPVSASDVIDIATM